MKSKRKVVAAMLMAGGMLLTAGAGFSIASAADTSPAATVPPPGPEGHHHGWGPEHLYSKLGLTAEQQASVKSIMTAAKPQMESMHQQMNANHMKLMQTKPDDPNYANVVTAVAQSEATLASERTSQHAELRSKMYAVLTPAQKTQLATLEAQWASQPHGHRGPPPAPPAE